MKLTHSAVFSVVLLAATLFGTNCKTPPPAPVTPVTSCPATSASAAPSASANVDAAKKAATPGEACCHLRGMACSLGNPTQKGHTCEDYVAGEACAAGKPAACIDVTCLANAKTCAEADRCSK